MASPKPNKYEIYGSTTAAAGKDPTTSFTTGDLNQILEIGSDNSLTLEVRLVAGTAPTSVSVALEGSFDKSSWANLGAQLVDAGAGTITMVETVRVFSGWSFPLTGLTAYQWAEEINTKWFRVRVKYVGGDSTTRICVTAVQGLK